MAYQHRTFALGGELWPVLCNGRAKVDIILVVENTSVSVLAPHGTAQASSAHPPHKPTANSPSIVIASDAPRSTTLLKLLVKSWLSGSNGLLQKIELQFDFSLSGQT